MRLVRLLLPLAALTGACLGSSPLRAQAPASLDTTGLGAVGPDSFVVQLTTSRGRFDLMVHRDWSPKGADRLFWLFTHGYYDGARFFRMVPGFVVQFGLSPDTTVVRAWGSRRFDDDPVVHSNGRGTLSFATSGPNTRMTQLFINLGDNQRLDAMGFSPVAQVVGGMAVVDSLYAGYGEGPPRGNGPNQDRMSAEGDAYIVREFPKLDRIVTARVVRRWP